MGTDQIMDYLIKDCQIVTMNPGREIIDRGLIGIKDHRLELIESSETVADLPQAAEVISGEGKVALPGLINAHSHLAMTLFRGFVEDLKLQAWLDKVWEYELSVLTEESVKVGSKMALAEMIKGGVTTAHDMYWHHLTTMELADELGFRLLSGSPITEVGGKGVDELVEEAREAVELAQGWATVHPVLQAHSIYTTSSEIMSAVRELKAEYGIPFTTHASENDSEVEEVYQKFGVSPIEQLEKFQVLDQGSVLAHCVQVTEDDLEILAETGAHVAHCPESNLKLGSGIAPVSRMVDRGINVCLGTDGAASNNDLDMLGEMRMVPLLQKGLEQDPRLIPTVEALEMATIAGAKAYGIDHLTGSLEVGKRADLALLDFQKIHLKPHHDVMAHLVYSANKTDVDTVWIDGRRVLKEGKLVDIDPQDLLAQAEEMADLFQEKNPEEG